MASKSGKQLSKLGIGTFGVGGKGHRDIGLGEIENDDLYIEALVYSLNRGMNFAEVSLGYGHGNTARLFKHALAKSEVKREDFFLTHSFYPRDLESIQTFYEDLENFYKGAVGTDYADSTLVTQSMLIIFGEEKVYKKLHELLNSGLTRYVSLSNASPNWIKKFKQEFGEKFFAHEGHLSFEVRALQDKGVFEICSNSNVKNIIWRPLRRSLTLKADWPLLDSLAKKYNKTSGQIILNWMIKQGFYPMVFSTKIAHIDENLDALSFKLNDKDYALLENFRSPNQSGKIDWEGESIDDDIVALTKL